MKNRSASDSFLTILSMLLAIGGGVGGMFVSAAYLTPVLIGSSHGIARHGVGKAVAFSMLFGGLFLGLMVGSIIVAALAKLFVREQTLERWDREFEQSMAGYPRPLRSLLRAVSGLSRPR